MKNSGYLTLTTQPNQNKGHSAKQKILKRGILMPEKHLMKYSKSLVIRARQVYTTLRFYLYPSERLDESQEIAYAVEDVEQAEHFFIAGGSANLYHHFGKTLVVSQKNRNSSTSRHSSTTPGHIPKR